MAIIKISKNVSAAKPVTEPAVIAPLTPPVRRMPEWWKKQSGLIATHCSQLANLPPGSLTHRDNVMIAALLGYGPREAHETLWKSGTITTDWIKIAPWFLHPEIGESMLPEDALWEIHRTAVEGGYGGWATLALPSSGKGPWKAEAKSSWAAWAIVLLQAFDDDAFIPKHDGAKS